MKPQARYVVFHCLDSIERTLSGDVKYYGSIDLIDARHPQTILAYGLNGKPQPTVRVNGDRLYTLVTQRRASDGLLELGFTRGLAAYAFTFG